LRGLCLRVEAREGVGGNRFHYRARLLPALNQNCVTLYKPRHITLGREQCLCPQHKDSQHLPSPATHTHNTRAGMSCAPCDATRDSFTAHGGQRADVAARTRPRRQAQNGAGATHTTRAHKTPQACTRRPGMGGEGVSHISRPEWGWVGNEDTPLALMQSTAQSRHTHALPAAMKQRVVVRARTHQATRIV
jgi:hypothetical protein